MSRIQKGVTLVLVAASFAVASTAVAGKPGGTYAPTLTTSLPAATAATGTSGEGTAYTISGCGYDASYGMVTVEVFTPVGVGWVAESPDANGCVSVTNFATVGHGDYKVDAWQHVKNKDQVVAETTFAW